MQNATAMLYCPNYSCQTPNPETHRFCQKCRTSLPRHYLWAVGGDAAAYQPGDLLLSRYLCKSSRIFLDTKPGLIFEGTAAEIPQPYLRYLRLTAYQLHIPQIYEILRQPNLLLLDQAAISPPIGTAEVQLLPDLQSQWAEATAVRQLHWLWQIAQLWQPLSSEKAASSLLLPDRLRVEGGLLRLLDLSADAAPPTLAQLGKLWLTWAASSQASIASYLEDICQQLIDSSIHSAEQLVDAIDRALAVVGEGQARQIQIATLTDQGPTRQRNEDACYPSSGSVKTQTIGRDQTAADPAIAIVCDGIGGHQGGDVASHLAIVAVQQQLQTLHPEQLDATALNSALENSVWLANDQISQRNDSEQRFDRQRMGTTLVMALVRAHELYVTHVGDSRAYLITRWNCRQVTLDDDIASREVRMGYSSYREALQQPGAGSLVQALGMAASNNLHPNVQRFVLDEDCVFLLCSDGLSDNDRVEECWETEILPLLEGSVDIATASQRLVAIANMRNGHDNVTVALVHCQVSQLQNHPPLAAPTVQTIPAAPLPTTTPPAPSVPSTLKTQIIPPSRPKPSSSLPLLLSILVLLGLGGILAYFLLPSIGSWLDPLIGLRPSPIAEPASPSVATPSVVAPIASPPLQVGSFLAVNSHLPSDNAASVPASSLPSLSSAPVVANSATPTAGKVLPPGSILQVVSQRSSSPGEGWVQVRVCQIPIAILSKTTTAPTPSTPPRSIAAPAAVFRPGETGWMPESIAVPLVVANPTAEQRDSCATTPTAPATPPPSSQRAG